MKPGFYGLTGSFLIIAAGFVLMGAWTPLEASTLFSLDAARGMRAYRSGKFDESLNHFKKAREKSRNSPESAYNAGAGFYKSGQYDIAEEAFRQALLSDDERVRAQAYYNLGNTLFKQGDRLLKSDFRSGESKLRESLGYFDKALALGVAQAGNNRQLVINKLEELKRQEDSSRQPGGQSASSDETESGQGRGGESSGKSSSDGDSDVVSKDVVSNETGTAETSKDSAGNDPRADNRQRGTDDTNILSSKASGDQEAAGTSSENGKYKRADEQKGADLKGVGQENTGSGSDTHSSGFSANKEFMTPEEADVFLTDLEQNELPDHLWTGALNRDVGSGNYRDW